MEAFERKQFEGRISTARKRALQRSKDSEKRLKSCREEFENRFTIDAEADQYEAIYRGEIAKGKSRGAERRVGSADSLDAAVPAPTRVGKNGGVHRKD